MRIWIVLAAALGIPAYGLHKNSLSKSGAIVAGIVGFWAFWAGYRFMAMLLAFFFTASRLTKIGRQTKERIEEGYKHGGQRNAIQVLSNASGALLLSILHVVYVGAGVDGRVDCNERWAASILMLAYMGWYASCNGDTWSSELGVLSASPPRLITTGQKVPAGTNGGITWIGCIAAVGGGLVVGIVAGMTEVHRIGWFGLWGAALGCFGSIMDSLLGATLQYSGWSDELGKVVNCPGPRVKHIAGKHILNNHSVNFISACLTACVAVAAGMRWF